MHVKKRAPKDGITLVLGMKKIEMARNGSLIPQLHKEPLVLVIRLLS